MCNFSCSQLDLDLELLVQMPSFPCKAYLSKQRKEKNTKTFLTQKNQLFPFCLIFKGTQAISEKLDFEMGEGTFLSDSKATIENGGFQIGLARFLPNFSHQTFSNPSIVGMRGPLVMLPQVIFKPFLLIFFSIYK